MIINTDYDQCADRTALFPFLLMFLFCLDAIIYKQKMFVPFVKTPKYLFLPYCTIVSGCPQVAPVIPQVPSTMSQVTV